MIDRSDAIERGPPGVRRQMDQKTLEIVVECGRSETDRHGVDLHDFPYGTWDSC